MELDFGEIDRLLELGEAERAAQLLEALSARAPGDPGIEPRAHRAAVVAFRYDLPRAPYRPEPRPAPEPGQLDLVRKGVV